MREKRDDYGRDVEQRNGGRDTEAGDRELKPDLEDSDQRATEERYVEQAFAVDDE